MPCTDNAMFEVHELAELNALAAHVIRRAVAVGTSPAPPRDDGRYIAPGACFVTLKQQHRLRACIGTLAAHRALRDDVAANALTAALRDPRFAPLAAHELPLTAVQVSVLSSPSILHFANQRDLFAQLRPGVDGLIIEHQGRSNLSTECLEAIARARIIRAGVAEQGRDREQCRAQRVASAALHHPAFDAVSAT